MLLKSGTMSFSMVCTDELSKAEINNFCSKLGTMRKAYADDTRTSQYAPLNSVCFMCSLARACIAGCSYFFNKEICP